MRMRPCVSSSRLSARYAAKNATSSTFAISLGSKLERPDPDPQPAAAARLPDARARAAAA